MNRRLVAGFQTSIASSEIHRAISPRSTSALSYSDPLLTRLFFLLLLGLRLLLLFRSQLSLFLFFSFALVFASATVAHIRSSSVRLEARNAPQPASKTQRHRESIAVPKDAVLCEDSVDRPNEIGRSFSNETSSRNGRLLRFSFAEEQGAAVNEFRFAAGPSGSHSGRLGDPI